MVVHSHNPSPALGGREMKSNWKSRKDFIRNGSHETQVDIVRRKTTTTTTKRRRSSLAKGGHGGWMCEMEEGWGAGVENSGKKSTKTLVWPLIYAERPVTKSNVVSKLRMVAHICNPASVSKRIMSPRPAWAIYSSGTLCQKEGKEGGKEQKRKGRKRRRSK